MCIHDEELMNKSSRSRAITEGAVLIALLLLLILLFGAAYDSVVVGAAPQQDATAQLPTAAPQPRPNPFPATNSMTETISSVLAAYNQNRIQADAGAGPVPVQLTDSLTYLAYITRPQPTVAPAPDPTVTPSPSPTTRPEPEPDPADVAVTLWPAPSIRVARDGTLAYEIWVRNYGDGAAEHIQVRLPYDKQRLTVTSSKFNDPADWVSE